MDFLTPRTRAGPVGTVIIGATKAYMKTSFKACNSITGIVGTSMCAYSLYRIIGACIRDRVFILPWFVGAFLGLGISLCVLACIGHAASSTRSSVCLSFSSFSDYQDVPEDPTGRSDDFLDYMESNIGLFRRVGLLVAVSQAMSLLLAMILRTEYHNEGGGDVGLPSTTSTIPFLDNPAVRPRTNAAASSPSFVSNKWIEY